MDVGIKTANDQFQTVTTAQRTALSPTVGQCVWDSDLRQLMVFMNASGGNAWQPVGNTIVCASTTRPSVPFEGQEIYETDTNQKLIYNGSSWIETGDLDNTNGVPSGLAPLFSAWTAWTPTITQTGNVTKTVTSATYLQIGKLVFAEFNLSVTGSGTGTVGITVSLPVTAKSKSGVRIGIGAIFDASTNTQYSGVCFQASTTAISYVGDWSGGGTWGATPAINLASGDNVTGTITYEAA